MATVMQRLVMVMGVQRSGTNAFFNSLAADTRYRLFNESDDSEVFFDWNLRPEPEIRALFTQPGEVLLKPVNETDFREVSDVLHEYRHYDVWIPWIYRDPVNVHHSWWVKWHTPEVDAFVEMWNRRNRSILNALSHHAAKIAIVSYEDLVKDRRVFDKVCRFFDIAGDYKFRPDSGSGRRALPADVIQFIDRGTAQVRAALGEARRHR
jgi:hypothetical protein